MVVGESSQRPVKDTTLTFQCLLLTPIDYTIWRMRMEVLLKIHGVWDVVDDAKKNNIVKGLLFQSISEDLILQIGNLKTGKEKWEAIKTRKLGAGHVEEARLQTLFTEFENLKMSDNDTIDAYAAKLSSATLGEQVLDFKTTGFEDVVGRLKVYEERVKQEDKANDSQEKLLYVRTNYSNRNSDSSRGRGCGSYSRGRGRGRGQVRGWGNSQNLGQRDSTKNHGFNEQKGKQHEKRNLSHIQCYRCDQYGHFVSKCPERNRNREVNLNETQEKGVYQEEGTFFMMNHEQETIFMNEEKYTPQKSESNTDDKDDVWYFDNGASNHSLGQATISGYDISIRDEEANPHSSWVTVHENNPESEEDKSGSDNTPNLLVRLETIRLLIVLAAGKGWKIQYLDLINEFKKRMASQFEMSDLGELTYYLGIEVSQGKDCVEIKQERYAMKILKEAGMEDCNATLCPMEPGLKLSKAKDERTTSFGIKYKRGNDMRLMGYSDTDDGRSTTGHVFYLGTSPITWCSQKQTTVALSSCEAEFNATIASACQAIWLREVLTEVIENEHVIVEHVSGDNQRADPLTRALAR
ncbi:uncharacterized mitochondrial protein-like protein [Tanacetum coccineum]|uniref:Uncharacterized mitochondrial protein-like protein n=1 Tax=Tanacetum coccineum TaxID=301880 RepID=A0ABQ5ILD8_9ASTR